MPVHDSFVPIVLTHTYSTQQTQQVPKVQTHTYPTQWTQVYQPHSTTDPTGLDLKGDKV